MILVPKTRISNTLPTLIIINGIKENDDPLTVPLVTHQPLEIEVL